MIKVFNCFLPLFLSILTGNVLANSNPDLLINDLSKQQNTAKPSLSPIIEKVTPSVVTVMVEGSKKVESRDNFQFFFENPFGFNPFGNDNRQSNEKKFKALGSGVIIDSQNGYIVTNNHVVDGAKKITIETNDGRQYEAKKIGSDPQTDFALLQVKGEKLVALSFADSDDLKVGDFAIAIGNPFGLGQTVTYGIISALGRSVDESHQQFENYIQTDAAINQGNSGGSLVDLNGQLIGINTAIIAPGGGNVGIGFAIPSNMIKSLSEQIIKYGEVRRGFLGITGGELTHDLAEKFGSSRNTGAFVSQVMEKSAAEKAGIKPGDIIVSIDGKEINSFNELRAKIATKGAGKSVKLGMIRDGKEISLDVVLKELESQRISSSNQEINTMFDGVKLSNATGNVKGAEVVEIDPKSKAARYGFEKGDIIVGVNREKVESVTDLNKVLSNSKGSEAFNIVRGNINMYIILR